MRVDDINQRVCTFLSIFIYRMSLLLSICARWCVCQQSEEASISTLNFFFTLTHLSLPFSTSITWLDFFFFFLALHSSTPFLPPSPLQHCSLSPQQPVTAAYSSSGTYRTLYIRSWVISHCHTGCFFPCFSEMYDLVGNASAATRNAMHTLTHWCTVQCVEMSHRCKIPSYNDLHSSTWTITHHSTNFVSIILQCISEALGRRLMI